MIALAATSIGEAAWGHLHANSEAVVVGATSRGVFLRLPSEKIVFLSSAHWRGPLTINLADPGSALQSLSPAMQAHLQPGRIFFEQGNLTISTDQAGIWAVDLPERQALPESQIQDRFRTVGSLIVQNRPGLPATWLLAELLELDLAAGPPDHNQTRQASMMASELKSARLIEGLTPLFGLGEGLTPWGDDLIIGLILTCKRWEGVFTAPPGLKEINPAVVDLAFRRTSALSATLIECAAQGQADERLIAGLDGILTGELNEAACAAYFLSWGNSSGAAVLAGAALAWLISAGVK